MPNKNKIVELLDELSPTAQLIGAVNTVRNDNGKLKGLIQMARFYPVLPEMPAVM